MIIHQNILIHVLLFLQIDKQIIIGCSKWVIIFLDTVRKYDTYHSKKYKSGSKHKPSFVAGSVFSVDMFLKHLSKLWPILQMTVHQGRVRDRRQTWPPNDVISDPHPIPHPEPPLCTTLSLWCNKLCLGVGF